jgi:hypothetical protein
VGAAVATTLGLLGFMLAFTFSAVMAVVADLDRPREGMVRVGQ